MQFGLLVRGVLAPQALVDLAGQLERWGFDSLWHANHPFERDVFIDLAVCAQHTSRLRLAAGVVDPITRHPAITAAAMASLDELSGGRALLGIGAGTTAFARLGFRRDRSLVRLREAIQLCRDLWSGQPVAFEGQVTTASGGPLSVPARRIPIHVGTRGPGILRLAGELADGVLISTHVTPAGVQWALEHIATGARRVGRRPEDVEVWLRPDVALHADAATARRAVKGMVFASLASNYPALEFLEPLHVQLSPELHAALASRAPAPDLVPDALVDQLALAGPPEDVEQRLAELAPLVGGRVLVCPWTTEGQQLGDVARYLAPLAVARWP